MIVLAKTKNSESFITTSDSNNLLLLMNCFRSNSSKNNREKKYPSIKRSRNDLVRMQPSHTNEAINSEMKQIPASPRLSSSYSNSLIKMVGWFHSEKTLKVFLCCSKYS